MTREEFIFWFEERFALTKNDIYELGQLYDEVTQQHWISVADELPDEGKYAATISKVGFQAVHYYIGGKWFSIYGNEYDDITHWLPLPQAPKKGGKQ